MQPRCRPRNSYAQARTTAALASANTYTDTRSTATLSSANAYTDQRIMALAFDFGGLRTEVDDRFKVQDKRINRNGAMSMAMMQMASNSLREAGTRPSTKPIGARAGARCNQ